MSDYKKTLLQPPRSYEELNKNRPTKKRNFNYGMKEEPILPSTSKPISSNYSSYRPKNEFSFEKKERAGEAPQAKETEVKELDIKSKYDSSPAEKKKKEDGYHSPSKRHDIDQRLNNISSINDKITGLLNVTRNKKDNWSHYNSPIKEKQIHNVDKSYVTKQDMTYTSRYLYDQEGSKTSRLKQSFKSKYAYTPDQDLPDIPKKELASKKYVNDSYTFNSATVNERKYDSNIGNNKGGFYTSKFSKDSPIKDIVSITPYKEYSPKESAQPVPNVPKVAEKVVEKPKETSPQKSLVRSRPNENRNALDQVRQNEALEDYKKEKMIIKNMLLDKQIKEVNNKINSNSPLKSKDVTAMNKQNVRQDLQGSPQRDEYPEAVETGKLANLMSQLVKADTALFGYKQAFESIKDQGKWQRLNSQLHIQKVYWKEEDLKDFMQVSIHQKNPFQQKKNSYSLNQVKDMAKLIAKADQLWNSQIFKGVSLDKLAFEGFSLKKIDINSKGTIGLEDLVLFINMNSGKFYRSRDVAPLYKRFLKIEHKTLEKNMGEGILYTTFMERVARQ